MRELDLGQYLRDIGLLDYIDQVHTSITEKHPMEEIEFDAWYTNRDVVFHKMCELSHLLAKRIRQDYSLNWKKQVPNEILQVLENNKVAPNNWEDSPDGTLTGMTILCAGWIASQCAAKTRDNPKSPALSIFQNIIHPLINTSMVVGTEVKNKYAKQQPLLKV